MSRAAESHPPVALGVAGGTGSGKTSVAEAILDEVGRQRIAFLAQDSYYRDIEWDSDAHLLHHNFDHPEAIDNELLVEHLRTLKEGRPVEVPIYDFVRHVRTAETQPVAPRPVILLEGILLFVEPDLRELLDLKVYVDTAADVRLMRRVHRDIRERGRTVDDVFRQYNETVRPMHLEFVEPSKRWADVIVPQGASNRVALEMVIARVEQLLPPLAP
jgi:uridine kinase